MTGTIDMHLLVTDTVEKIVFLCIQIAIDKIHARPYHNPTATMEHSVHNVDSSKSLDHTT